MFFEWMKIDSMKSVGRVSKKLDKREKYML